MFSSRNNLSADKDTNCSSTFCRHLLHEICILISDFVKCTDLNVTNPGNIQFNPHPARPTIMVSINFETK